MWVAKESIDADESVKAKIEKMFEALDDDEDANGIFSNVQF